MDAGSYCYPTSGANRDAHAAPYQHSHSDHHYPNTGSDANPHMGIVFPQ